MKPNTKKDKIEIQIPDLNNEGIESTITVEVELFYNEKIDEYSLTQESLDLIEEERLKYLKILSPNDIKAIRDSYGMSQREISKLLQIGEKSWTRWENGKNKPSRSINLFLRCVQDGTIGIVDLKNKLGIPVDWKDAYYQRAKSPIARRNLTQLAAPKSKTSDSRYPLPDAA